MATRIVLALVLLACLGMAGVGSAHYLVELDTPVGTVCAVNEEAILDGLRNSDPAGVASGVVTTGCD